jgi:hypothetical protein
MNNKQYMYYIQWSQPYMQQNIIKEAIIDEIIELYLEQECFDIANNELKRIMKL